MQSGLSGAGQWKSDRFGRYPSSLLGNLTYCNERLYRLAEPLRWSAIFSEQSISHDSGSCELEPQTSTVSICWPDWEQIRWSGKKLHRMNRSNPRHWQALAQLVGDSWNDQER